VVLEGRERAQEDGQRCHEEPHRGVPRPMDHGDESSSHGVVPEAGKARVYNPYSDLSGS
jgi:hypothetical protein